MSRLSSLKPRRVSLMNTPIHSSWMVASMGRGALDLIAAQANGLVIAVGGRKRLAPEGLSHCRGYFGLNHRPTVALGNVGRRGVSGDGHGLLSEQKHIDLTLN